MITITSVKKIPGPKTYCLKVKDKEAYIVSISEIYGAHGLPIYTVSLTNDIQQLLHDIGKLSIVNEIKHDSTKGMPADSFNG